MVLKASRASLVMMERPVHRVNKAFKVYLATMAHRAQMVRTERKEFRACKAMQVHRAIPVLLVLKVSKGYREFKGRPALPRSVFFRS